MHRLLGLLPALLLAAAVPRRAAEAGPVQPFENELDAVTATELDGFVLDALRKNGITPANVCSDEVFVRRVYLDVIGTLPDPDEVRRFLRDERPDRRAALIEELFKRDEFADYWAMKWCDLLRVKAEFPVNLWPNAAQAYHRWVRDGLRENRPYDRIADELLTSSGSNFRVPAVNFYRAIQGRSPSALAAAVALTFLGTRMESLPPDRRAGLAAVFTRVSYKKTAEWKEEIVLLNPAPTNAVTAVLPDGTRLSLPPEEDPRRVFAAWLISPDNAWFAPAMANRQWAWLFGRGIVHEPDDFRPDNPPSNPELLAFLARELVKSRYDLRQVLRLILNSRTYQQSPIPRTTAPEGEALFAFYPVRRLDAEVLIDALNWIGGTGEEYSSAIPEPFTFIPSSQRTIALADGSITSSFLEMFGRPPRDTGLFAERNNQPSDAQRLHLLNSSSVQRKIERSPRLNELVKSARGDRKAVIGGVYLALLSRAPTPAEQAAAEAYFGTRGSALQQAASDLAWSLINGKEFLYRH